MAAEHPSILTTPSMDAPVLKEVLKRLVAAYQPERIYLFGSVARGDADRDSDYDFLVGREAGFRSFQS